MDPATDDKVAITLSGVPETLLWPLYFRVSEAKRDPAFFSDPLGTEIIDRIAYDFSRFGRTNAAHAVRSKFCDALIGDFLRRHPHATVVALGEGLETQLWRVDNGTVEWLTIDLPEAIAVRRKLLPDHPRNRILTCSALDPAWLTAVDKNRPLFITAAGLLMYFKREDVLTLLQMISQRAGRAELFFDTIPPWLSRRTLRGWKPTRWYTTPPMPFGLAFSRISRFAAEVPGLTVRRAVTYPEAYSGKFPILQRLARIPWIREKAPALVHAAFHAGGAPGAAGP